jgi:ABC-type nitrate/sulfonate/bicarbonate transport system substrate-binding protein
MDSHAMHDSPQFLLPTPRARVWRDSAALPLLLAAGVLAATAVRGPAVWADTNPAPAKVVVRLKWVHQAQFAGFYAAEQKGLYRRVGLEVDVRPGGVDFPAIQMVASGSEEFGVTGADQVLLARDKGVPVVAVATIYRQTPFVLFALKKSGISAMKDLAGKTVGVKLGGNEELTYRAMVTSAGLRGDRPREIPVKFDISPFLAGKVDVWPGYLINEVIAAQEKGAEVNIIRPSDYNINFYADTIFTTESVIEKNPDLVKRFVRATMAGWQYAVDHPDEAAALGLKHSPQLVLGHETSMMRASIPLLRPTQQPLGKMQLEEWRSLDDQLVALGLLKRKADIYKAFTNRFLSDR